MARSFSETACQPNPGRSRPHSLGPMNMPEATSILTKEHSSATHGAFSKKVSASPTKKS